MRSPKTTKRRRIQVRLRTGRCSVALKRATSIGEDMEHLLENRDFLVFAVIALASFALLHVWLRRKAIGAHRGVPASIWALLLAIVACGGYLADRLGHEMREKLEGTVVGYAPTYALEIERLGHAAITLDTAPDDPRYLAIIAAERRWLDVNPAVADIYTLRRDDQGTLRLIVDAETDYDRNGRFEGDREGRTEIGEVLDVDTPTLAASFAGTGGFDPEIETDRWGTWVSAYWPIHDAAGRIEAVVGVDYAAADWLSEIRVARWDALVSTAVILLVLFGATRTYALRGIELDMRQRHAEALTAARDAAESASALKSQFLARMSHEIRTPINGVMGVTELLLQTTLDTKQQHFGELIYRSATTLLDVINDILDYSKIEAGKLTLEHIDFTPREIFEDVAELLAARAQGKGLDLNLDLLVDDGCVLRGDPARLRQLVTNLVGNAIKFTAEGEVTLVGRWTEVDGMPRLRCEVRDTGPGIEPSMRETLFEPFVQADSSTTRRFGGTGLGLAICRRLVEAMGGTIDCAARPEGGSVFWFEVPLERSRGRLDAASAVPARGAGLRDLKVLIVDDNTTNREILTHVVDAWGMRHATAAHGRQALAMLHAAVLAHEAFDIAILDLDMPAMDGLELARRIKVEPAIAATRLLMLSSVCHLAGDAVWRAAGIERYLTKPVRQQQLFLAINEMLGIGTAQLAAQPMPSTPPSTSLPRFIGRVLLAEDNAINQVVAQHALESLGFDVVTVDDGRQAVAAVFADGARFTAVLMDCEMPELDGRAAAEEIRTREAALHRARLPIIALTAHAMESDRQLCLAVGMDDYLSKPFTVGQLGTTLTRWIAPCPDAMPASDTRLPSPRSVPEPA